MAGRVPAVYKRESPNLEILPYNADPFHVQIYTDPLTRIVVLRARARVLLLSLFFTVSNKLSVFLTRGLVFLSIHT